MGCEHNGGGFYRPRQPKKTAFYQLVERFYPQFKAVYEERYQERYGFWRPIIATAVEKFLECGDLQQGFARVRCPEYLLKLQKLRRLARLEPTNRRNLRRRRLLPENRTLAWLPEPQSWRHRAIEPMGKSCGCGVAYRVLGIGCGNLIERSPIHQVR